MTESYDQAVGRILRRLRHQRHLTLRAAAQLLCTSAPVLSRKERGQDRIEREDIAEAVHAYDLSPWEAYELWTAAGFIPEPTRQPPLAYDVRSFAESLLPGLRFPALLLDTLGYIIAWNEGFETLWGLSRSISERIHMVDELFTSNARERLGGHWGRYICQTLRVFYLKTLPIANDPAFRELLAQLAERHDPDFTQFWNETHRSQAPEHLLPPTDIGPIICSHTSPFGPIEYTVLQSIVHFFPLPYDLIVYVPLGAENNQRYFRLVESQASDRVYMRV